MDLQRGPRCGCSLGTKKNTAHEQSSWISPVREGRGCRGLLAAARAAQMELVGMSRTAPLLGKTKAAADTSSYRAPASLPRAAGGPAVNGALPVVAGSSTTAVPFVLGTRCLVLGAGLVVARDGLEACKAHGAFSLSLSLHGRGCSRVGWRHREPGPRLEGDLRGGSARPGAARYSKRENLKAKQQRGWWNNRMLPVY